MPCETRFWSCSAHQMRRRLGDQTRGRGSATRSRCAPTNHCRPSETLPRSRSSEHPSTTRRAKLTLVSAPPGFGKTTLLAEWLADPDSDDHVTAWVSLDPTNNEPGSFWAAVATAIHRALPDSVSRAAPAQIEQVFWRARQVLGAGLQPTRSRSKGGTSGWRRRGWAHEGRLPAGALPRTPTARQVERPRGVRRGRADRWQTRPSSRRRPAEHGEAPPGGPASTVGPHHRAVDLPRTGRRLAGRRRAGAGH